MKFEIPYGKESINLNIPERNIVSAVSSSYDWNMHRGQDENEIILNALKNPVDSKDLTSLAQNKNNVSILVSDITRPCPSYKFLPHIVAQLKEAGVKEINIIFGLGIHRSHSYEEKVRLAGEFCAQNCNLIDSDSQKCRYIGTTPAGTPVEVFEDVLKSDLLIATGNIEYHYFAGYSGGAKALMPGVCSRKSVSSNHSMMLEEKATAGIFAENPVRQDIEQAGKIANIGFIFNVILDDSKKIIGAVAGSNNNAFIEGIKLYDSIYETSIGSQVDIVITSPGGYPKDINLYQSQKALESVKGIVKQGGTIILVAECPEGFGEDVFAEWMAGVNDYESLHDKIKKEFVLGGHKAVVMAKLLRSVRILYYRKTCGGSYEVNNDYTNSDGKSDKSKSTCNFGFKTIDDIQSFLDFEIQKNRNLQVAVVPNGRFIKYI